MTTWTRQQVEQVASLGAVMMLDPEAIERARADVLTETRRRLVARLVDMAHAFVTEPHPGDFQFRQSDEDEDGWYRVRVEARWRPETREVELRGGEWDGKVLEVEGAPWQDIQLYLSGPPPWLMGQAEVHPWTEAGHKVVYRMTGWLEDERRWVYTNR